MGPQRGRTALQDIVKQVSANGNYREWSEEQVKALREEHDAEKKLKESIVSRRTNTASLNRDIGLTASSLQEQVCMLCFRFYPLFNYASCFQIDLLNLRTGCGVVMIRDDHGSG